MKFLPRKAAMLPVLFVLAFCRLLPAQDVDSIRAKYTKHEYRIPMRDGKELFTAVYTPKDTGRRYPILLIRTPYSVRPYGVDNYPATLGPSEKFARSGFIFAYQDVRGCFMSEGEFVNMRPQIDHKNGPGEIDESSDTYDTIDWLVKNVSGNNGKVGMWGISYPGFYAAAGMIDAHPALVAVSPQAPIADWFVGDDFHHNGAFYLPHAFGFFANFGRLRARLTTEWGTPYQFPTPDGYSFYLGMGSPANAAGYLKNEIPFWDELMKHGTYDEFWQARNLRPHLRNIRPAVMTVGGWFDAEDLFGALNVYKTVEKNSPGAYNILVMGPWYHGGWSRSDGETIGPVHFGSKTGVFYRDEIEFPFFDYFLKGNGQLNLPEAYVFESGTNQWRREEAWPPGSARSRRLYFHAGGKLNWDPPKEESGRAFDEYVSDPAKPVPYINEIAIGMTREHMVEDQRFASRRTDVLAYQTDELSEDTTIVGPVIPSLEVSTTGTDSDWVVKLIDIYPDNMPDPQPNPAGIHLGGYQQLVRGEAMRGKFRNSYEDPEALVPGQITKVEYTMPDVFHTFRRGHRIMVQVQSSWFPLVDRNPQKFTDIYSAKESDFQKATQRVYRSKDAPSGVRVNVLN
jgi:putative CocE/NonD family hydrolase